MMATSSPAPIALVDVDGVVADFTHAVCAGTPLRPEDVTQFDIFGLLRGIDPKWEKAAYERLASRTFWAGLEPIEGAAEGVHALRQRGFDVVFLTAPWWSCDGWEKVRRRWLSEYMDAERNDVVICPSARKPLVAGALLVEDRKETLLAWSQRWPRAQPFLFDQPYNRETTLPASKRLFGWDDLADKLDVMTL